MAVTIKDLASYLNLSPATVSRALRDSPRVSEETKHRVLKAARELGYTPNMLARGLAQATAEIIGCMVLDLANPFFVTVVQAIEEAIDEKGYIAVVSETKREQEIEKRLVERLNTIRPAGLIITPVLKEIDHLLAFAHKTPLVLVGREYHSLSYVTADNVYGGEVAGEHLISLGHTRIGVVMSGEPYNFPEKDRVEGLKRALKEAGLKLPEQWQIMGGRNDLESGLKAAKIWLNLYERPSAIFAVTDLLAMGFIHGVRQAGVRVPDDVAVVGFDDIYFAPFFEVPLTTMALPKYEMGRIAVELLFDKIESGIKPANRIDHIILRPELVIRESCGGKLSKGSSSPGQAKPFQSVGG
jgi:DNA-binding LacI/PurR family transcriptional regulator